MIKRIRRPNFTEKELLLLLKILAENKELITYDSNLYGEELSLAWENVANQYSSQTAVPRCGRDLQNKFADLKSRTKKKVREISRNQKFLAKTGGGQQKHLNEVEKLVVLLASKNSMSDFDDLADSFAEVKQSLKDLTNENVQIKKHADIGQNASKSYRNLDPLVCEFDEFEVASVDICDKDEILTYDLASFVTKNNLMPDVTDSLLKILTKYGCKLPKSHKILMENHISEDDDTYLHSDMEETEFIGFEKPNLGYKMKNSAEKTTTNDDIAEILDERYCSIMQQLVKMEKTLLTVTNRGDEKADDNILNFPLNTTEDLEQLNAQCDETNMIEIFRRYTFSGIYSIFSRRLLLEHSWTGTQRTKNLSQYRHLHETIFAAFKSDPDMLTMQQYEDMVQSTIKKAHLHKHYYSRKCREEKKRNELLSIQVNVDENTL